MATPNSAAGVKAIYFLTNDQNNSVVALPIAADGTLTQGTVTPTGGEGGNSIDGATGQPAAPDALVGQSALTIAGHVSRTSWAFKPTAPAPVVIDLRTLFLTPG